MRQFLFIALFFASCSFTSSVGRADDCPDMQLDGNWKMANQPTFFSKVWRSYNIKQDGCYVLVYDSYRKSTWKIDLTGQHKIRVPREQVEANLHGGGPTAAQNMANLEVTLVPKPYFPNQTSYHGIVTADPYLEEQKSFPVSMKAHFAADLNIDGPSPTGMCPPICETNPRRIQMQLTEFQVLDISKGLPSNIDKGSFLGGLNMFARMFVKAFSYKLTLLDLVKDQ